MGRRLKAMIAVNVVFFFAVLVLAGLLELGLRAGGFRFSLPLLDDLARRKVLEPGSAPGTLRIAPDLRDAKPFGYHFMLPEPPGDIQIAKEPGTVRVVVVGDSSGHRFNGAKVEFWQCLEAEHPRVVEYINLSFAGCGSDRTLPTAIEALALHPDVMVIATGHSDFVSHCNSAAFMNAEGPVIQQYSPAFRWAFTHLRVIQLLARYSTELARVQMSQMRKRVVSLEVQRRYSPEEKRVFDEALRRNLTGIAEAAANAGVRLVFSTMPYNYEYPPQWEMTSGGQPLLERDGALSSRELAGKAGILDHYLYGRALWREGKWEAGKRAMDEAYRASERPYVATTVTNSIIREVANRFHVPLADSKSLIDLASPRQLADNTLMEDHCHTNLAGSALVARELCRKVSRALSAPASTGAAP